jgi:hypothetical protein
MFSGFSSGDHHTWMVGRDCINGDCVYVVTAQDFIKIGIERNIVLFRGISASVFLFVPDGDEFGFRVFVNFPGVTTSVDVCHANLCDSNHLILLIGEAGYAKLFNPCDGRASCEVVPATKNQLDVGVPVFGFDLIVTRMHLNEDTLSRLV